MMTQNRTKVHSDRNVTPSVFLNRLADGTESPFTGIAVPTYQPRSPTAVVRVKG